MEEPKSASRFSRLKILKHKIPYFILFILSSLYFGFVGYQLGVDHERNVSSNQLKIPTLPSSSITVTPFDLSSYPTRTPTPSPTPYLLTDKNYTPPEKNTIYSATLSNKPVIYYLNGRSQYIDANRRPFINPYEGTVLESGTEYNYDFRILLNPQKNLVSSEEIEDIINFIQDKKDLYISYITDVRKDEYSIGVETNRLVKIDMSNLAKEEIWPNILSRDSEKYGESGGMAKIISVNDNYIMLSLYTCYHCTGIPNGTLVLNTLTKKEIFLPFHTKDLKINIDNNTFSYYKLKLVKCDPIKESCQFYWGEKFVVDGELMTQSLP